MQCQIADTNGNDIQTYVKLVKERSAGAISYFLEQHNVGRYLCFLLFRAFQIFPESFFKDSVSLHVALLVVWTSVQSVESHQLIICG